jgi:cation diffusion facilitator CzcD-associated flavoprotein CzcO
MSKKSTPSQPERPSIKTQVLIVGTGFAGIGMAIRMKQRAMHDFVIVEAAGDVGGTWRDNHYPGAACDVMSHLYSFSFEPNPNWSRMYAPQGEILAYMRHCVEKYGLRQHMRFNQRVTQASFDESSGTWSVDTSSDRFVAKALVTGTGGLSRPTLPEIDGIEGFRGKAFHSARWEHEYDLTGKTVAVIGTGASAIQIVPEIAKKATKLYVYQRTAPWIMPRMDRDIGAAEQTLFEKVPATQFLYREFMYWRAELTALGFVVDPRIMRFGEKLARRHLEKQVPDPVLRAKVTPSYTIGCKRVLVSNDYYPALMRPNVELVAEAVDRLDTNSVVSATGERREVDAVVYCSGFTASESQAPFPVRGLGGRDLDTTWRDGSEAYLGTTISGFPSLFTIVGPNTGLGHSSMIFMIEAQIDHILGCLDLLESKKLRYIDVRADVQDRFNQEIQAKFAKTVWSTGCKSWYQTRSGKNTTLWPGFTWQFRMRVARVNAADYRLVEQTGRAATPNLGDIVRGRASELLN